MTEDMPKGAVKMTKNLDLLVETRGARAVCLGSGSGDVWQASLQDGSRSVAGD